MASQDHTQRLVEKFGTWTSGDIAIDAYLHKTQAKADEKEGYLEWIAPNQFTNLVHIGDGAFGSVYRATWKNAPVSLNAAGVLTDGEVALKVTRCSSTQFLNELSIMFESDILTNIRTGIPHVFGVTKHKKSNQYAIVMELFEESSLRDFKEYDTLSWNLNCYHLQRISAGLAKLHKRDILHCDLHSGNVLCDSWRTFSSPVISDFGLSKSVNAAMQNTRGTFGVIPYVAPEVLRGQPHTKASDIYSLGIIMWELYTGKLPFSDWEHNANLMKAICDGMRPPILKGMPKCWVSVMKACWDADPAERPTATDVNFVATNGRYDSHEPDVLDSAEQQEPRQSTRHPHSFYVSRFIPSIPVLEAYTTGKGLHIDEELRQLLLEWFQTHKS